MELKDKYPNSEFVNKKFGDGKKAIKIGFNEHRRIGLLYIIFVDSKTEVHDMHELAEKIENHLVEEYGLFDRHEDYEQYIIENNLQPTDDIFNTWFTDQFPAVDIHGGCSNWNEV